MLSSTTDPLPSSASAASATGRQLIVVRHGERCDFVFNRSGAPSWVARAFDSNGKYKPFDVNLPRSLPKRSDGIEQFEHDTPLTEMGYLQAKLLGRAMRDRGIRIDAVYSSHSLRCVQTAVGILKGVGAPSTLSICIEPGLFEWMQWCRGTKPSAMSRYELAKNGYPVNMQYVEMVRDSELQLDETLEQYYHRSDSVIRAFLRQQTGPGTILVVAHSGSLEACTRLLCGGPARSSQDFYYILSCDVDWADELELQEACEKMALALVKRQHTPNLYFNSLLFCVRDHDCFSAREAVSQDSLFKLTASLFKLTATQPNGAKTVVYFWKKDCHLISYHATPAASTTKTTDKTLAKQCAFALRPTDENDGEPEKVRLAREAFLECFNNDENLMAVGTFVTPDCTLQTIGVQM